MATTVASLPSAEQLPKLLALIPPIAFTHSGCRTVAARLHLYSWEQGFPAPQEARKAGDVCSANTWHTRRGERPPNLERPLKNRNQIILILHTKGSKSRPREYRKAQKLGCSGQMRAIGSVLQVLLAIICSLADAEASPFRIQQIADGDYVHFE